METTLVKRLRDPAFGTETSERNLMNAAADRIDELQGHIRDFIRALDRGYLDCKDDSAFIDALRECVK